MPLIWSDLFPPNRCSLAMYKKFGTRSYIQTSKYHQYIVPIHKHQKPATFVIWGYYNTNKWTTRDTEWHPKIPVHLLHNQCCYYVYTRSHTTISTNYLTGGVIWSCKASLGLYSLIEYSACHLNGWIYTVKGDHQWIYNSTVQRAAVLKSMGAWTGGCVVSTLHFFVPGLYTWNSASFFFSCLHGPEASTGTSADLSM